LARAGVTEKTITKQLWFVKAEIERFSTGVAALSGSNRRDCAAGHGSGIRGADFETNGLAEPGAWRSGQGLSKVGEGGMGLTLLKRQPLQTKNHLQIIFSKLGKLMAFVPKSNLRAGGRKELSRFS
jgi:hypothetical protein